MDKQRRDLEILMKLYRSCCERRLRLWLDGDVKVAVHSPLSFRVEHHSSVLEFVFLPRTCLWLLSQDDQEVMGGDFDRVTKRARQLFTVD